MSTIKVALVLGTTESDLEVVDLLGIMPLDATHYIIETPLFANSNLIQNGAGTKFTLEQLIRLVLPHIQSSMQPSVASTARSYTEQTQEPPTATSYMSQTHEPPILRDSIIGSYLDQTAPPFGGYSNRHSGESSIDQPIEPSVAHSIAKNS